MTEMELITDKQGNERRLGTLVRPRTHKFKAFSDLGIALMSMEEIKERATKKVRSRDRFGIEWIKDQESHGSCNGFAGAEATERVRESRGLERVPLSGSSLYSLINGGRDDGSALEDGMKALTDIGLLPESECKTNEIYKDSNGRLPSRARFRILDAYVPANEQELATGLCSDFFAVVAVHVGRNFQNQGSGGIAGGDSGPGNHSVALDDVIWDPSAGSLKYDLPNSWGTSFADSGRTYVTWRRHLQPTYGYHQFYLIRGVIDDPQGSNPPTV